MRSGRESSVTGAVFFFFFFFFLRGRKRLRFFLTEKEENRRWKGTLLFVSSRFHDAPASLILGKSPRQEQRKQCRVRCSLAPALLPSLLSRKRGKESDEIKAEKSEESEINRRGDEKIFTFFFATSKREKKLSSVAPLSHSFSLSLLPHVQRWRAALVLRVPLDGESCKKKAWPSSARASKREQCLSAAMENSFGGQKKRKKHSVIILSSFLFLPLVHFSKQVLPYVDRLLRGAHSCLHVDFGRKRDTRERAWSFSFSSCRRPAIALLFLSFFLRPRHRGRLLNLNLFQN